MNERSQQQRKKRENRNELCAHRSRQCSSKAHYGVISKRTKKKVRHKKLFKTHDSSPLSFLSSRMRRGKKFAGLLFRDVRFRERDKNWMEYDTNTTSTENENQNFYATDEQMWVTVYTSHVRSQFQSNNGNPHMQSNSKLLRTHTSHNFCILHMDVSFFLSSYFSFSVRPRSTLFLPLKKSIAIRTSECISNFHCSLGLLHFSCAGK